MYWSTWFHTHGLVILNLNRSMTVGDISRLSDTDLHWNCMRPAPVLAIVARLALTDW